MKMYSINKKEIEQWKADVQKSVLFYNEWFMNFAPSTYVKARQDSINRVENAFQKTECLIQLSMDMLKAAPEIITILRMATTPPLARDRLIGLAGINGNLLDKMEEGCFPPKMSQKELNESLARIIAIINRLLDADIMPWLSGRRHPHKMERVLATHVIGDRVCGSFADPIIRNEQEHRQISSIGDYLARRGYRFVETKSIDDFRYMEAGTFTYHLNVLAKIGQTRTVNIPIDVVIKRKDALDEGLPLLVECKSAGDFTNTNKRRKEEATKIEQLRNTYGKDVEFVLFLCGYFDSGYLGYEAAEGIDWVWEHRIEDFEKAGI